MPQNINRTPRRLQCDGLDLILKAAMLKILNSKTPGIPFRLGGDRAKLISVFYFLLASIFMVMPLAALPAFIRLKAPARLR